jgi:crossover junction endodeoxyribonuclease RuvC
VILLAMTQHQMPVAEYTPMQVKQAVSGYGGADKHQVQVMVQVILALQDLPKPDDAADALAIAICHLHSYRWNQL